MEINIRSYQDSDFESVKKNLIESGMFNEPWDSKENLLSMTENDPESVLVAIVDGLLAGSITISHYGGKTGYLHRLAVSTKFRKMGIGSMLLMSRNPYLRIAVSKKSPVLLRQKNPN